MAAAAEEKPMLNTAAVQECGESAAGIFWPVFLTLVVVFVALLIVYFFWKYYWRIRHGKHLVLVTDVEKAEPEFAFDNPGFREGTPVIQAKKLSADIKEKDELNENSHKLSNGHKPQSLEDGALNKVGTNSDQKTNVIPLKSKDFTGLGFDICGNMRDGIYVKDLLHRGPASETGMIKQGDRISAIRINFSHMVYEDAKAILSYASPYEVEIEVEDSSMLLNAGARNSPNSTHSFYRSQSFSTAQQIQKIIPRKLNFNSMDKNPQTTSEEKPAILEVSEVSDKMFKYGVKVLPDIKLKPLSEKSAALTTSEVQQQANCNSTVIDIQSDSGIDTKTPTMGFDEVDLSLPVSHHREKPTSVSSGSSLTSTFKDANVISKLGKGIQNIKEKLNNRIQKTGEKISASKETELQKVDSKKLEEQMAPASPKTNASSTSAVDDVDFKPQEDINLRLRSSSTSSNENESKKFKRKAPLPPVSLPDSEFNLLNEIENEVNKNNYECKDSDSEAEHDINTIELNSSHITVHHIPEESSRKAASLGDLSKITEDSPVPLERAVSLELTEHTPRGSKKRKAPLPPEEDLTNEELFPKDSKSDLGLSKLKKSSLFGTLEEAVKTNDESSPSSDTNDMLTSSTPMKIPDEDNKFLSIESNCSNISWELNFDLQDDSKDNVFAEIDEKVPDLPTSPMPNPNLPTYVTEINVSNGDDDDLSKVNISDLTLFVTAAEISQNGKPSNDESCDTSKTLEPVDNKSLSNGTSSHSNTSADSSTSTNDYENEDSKDDSSIDTVKEMTYTNGIGENHTPKEVSVEMKPNQKSFSKYSKENMSDEQIVALSSPTNTTPSLKKGKIKSPSSTNKIPKLSQSVSPIKAAGSRIPIRANTEPSLKVSLIHKEDIVVPKPRKYKLSEDGLENDKPVTFASSNHLPSPTHKTSVLSETRHNGPNR